MVAIPGGILALLSIILSVFYEPVPVVVPLDNKMKAIKKENFNLLNY